MFCPARANRWGRTARAAVGEPQLSRHVPCAQPSDPLAQPESLEHLSLFGARDTPAPDVGQLSDMPGVPDPIRNTHRIASIYVPVRNIFRKSVRGGT
jgi:hypothetical protein